MVPGKAFTAVVLFLSALLLSSCGGGGSGSGFGIGPGTPVTGGDALLSVAAFNPWPRVTVALVDGDSSTGYRVTGMARNDAGGLDVTYVAGGRERTIRLESSDADGTLFRAETSDLYVVVNLVDEDFEHFDIGDFFVNSDGDLSSGYLIEGSRTAVGNLPSGSAIYRGRAEIFRKAIGSIDPDPERRFPVTDEITGYLVLIANLGTGSLEGTIDQIVVQEERTPWADPVAGAQFRIENGRIERSAFTADLTGSGTHLEGFAGNIHGALYGTEANEVGGVIGARRGENDILIGYFGGRQDSGIPLGPWEDLAHSGVKAGIMHEGYGLRVWQDRFSGDPHITAPAPYRQPVVGGTWTGRWIGRGGGLKTHASGAL